MRIIYSYNTFNGKRVPTDFEMRLAALSVKSVQAVTDYSVILYTDLYGKDIFAHLFDLDQIYLAGFMFDNPKFWNTGKIEVYEQQSKPFLHVDFDTVFMKGFMVPEADIVTEKLREYEFSENLSRYCLGNYSKPEKLICSGLLGGTERKTISCFAALGHNLMIHSGDIDNCKNPTFEHLVGLEEYPLSQIAKMWDLSIAELDPRYFAHFQGENKQQRFGKIIDDLCRMYNIK